MSPFTSCCSLWFTVRDGLDLVCPDCLSLDRVVTDMTAKDKLVPDHSRRRNWEPDREKAGDRVEPAEPDMAEQDSTKPNSPAEIAAEHTEEVPDRHPACTATALGSGPEPEPDTEANTTDCTAADTAGSDTPYLA